MSTETENTIETEAEFYDLLWNEMDRVYAKYPPQPIVLCLEDMKTDDSHINPERD